MAGRWRYDRCGRKKQAQKITSETGQSSMIAGRRNAGDGLAMMATQYTMLSGTMQCRAVMQIRMRTYSTKESPIILERLGTLTVAQVWSLFP